MTVASGFLTSSAVWPERPLAAPEVVSKAHLELAEPRAVVFDEGLVKAGARAELDALATAAQAARELGLDVEEVLVVSTDGEPAPRTSRARGRRFTVVGAATTPALVTTDYPLAGGEAAELLPAEAGAVLLSTGAAELARTPASDEEFAVALGLVCNTLQTLAEVAA